MPALSPTMTEGSISSWKIKEGEKFSAGDVLLEIETDKAQMDVEAQDDGILAKIFVTAGKEMIPVGKRIGILADPDDDIASLEIPPDESPSPSSSAIEESSQSSEPTPSPPSEPAKSSSTQEASAQDSNHHHARKNPFVPSPSLIHLLHSSNLQLSDIKGSGPEGRVLKGDILAHVGSINKEKPTSLAAEIGKLAKLDLSNIVPKKKAETPSPVADKKAETKKGVAVEAPKELELAVDVSLHQVLYVQKKLHRSIKINVPISSFIARAVARANFDLPPSRLPQTPSQIFDQIIGLPTTTTYTSPQIAYLPTISTESLIPVPPPAVPTADIFDEIIGAAPSRTPSTIPGARLSSESGETVNVLRLRVPKEDEARGVEFLTRVKSVLEERPEELVV